MKKVLKLFFVMIISVNGLSGMFSSEDNGKLPQQGFRFKHRSVHFNKDLRLVIPKTCRDQKLYDWVLTGKDDKGQEIWERREVIKKEVDPNLLDDEGNLIVAQWFASKKLSFQEPEFKKETVYENEYKQWSPYGTSYMAFKTTENIKHAYDDEYNNSYTSDEVRARNKQKIHSYINSAQSQQGIYTYIRGMKIVEYFFGKSQSKKEHCFLKHEFYDNPLHQEWPVQMNQLRNSLEQIEDTLKTDNTNDMQKQDILQKQKGLVTKEIQSFVMKENYPSFQRSSMKRSEFNKYVQFCKIIENE